MATTYEYNSFNQVKKQFSPDGGTSEFWYDRLGRLVASQNEEQRLGADTYGLGTNRFSYTKYDALGRITEVGEKTNASANPRTSNFLDIAQVNAFLNTGSSAQIIKTIYDQALFPYQNPSTSRKRVSATTYQDTEAETDPDASYYSYDIMGNVKTLIQRSKMLVAADNSNGEKRIDYQYDLISGKVNKVIYQPDKGDQFIHRYDYDADNRIISVNTSRDGLIWQNDAKYVYHLHGPLARTELGDQKVQGLDYAYTLQGWLKGVNSSSLHDGLFDIGQDGKTGGSLPIVGRDAFGYMLDYYIGDYKPIGQQAFSLNTFTSPSPTPATGFKSLYNGNIGGMVTNIRQLNTAQYTYYHYDQLNRIKRMEALHGQNAAANTWTFGLRFNGYIESFTYDPNGNIKTLARNSNVEQIDDLTYNYLAGTNKLTSVTDPIASGLVNYDIDGQAANNYSYDRIGNMTSDNAEGITNISWTVYGKIKNITKSNGTIEYRYDASGNRIYKKTVISGATTETYYARDAQGNVMAVYEKQAANPLKWMEQHLYGSSRLGMWNLADVVPATTIPASGGTVEDGYLYGSKFFELSNHLGNVLVTVSDKKIGIDEGGNGTTDYFQPEVLTAQDYYSFGMSMPGRKYTKPNSGYRYGFNGKENDNDVKGDGNQQDYGMRIYDPRLGKFLSVDPLTKQYPWLSTYHYASNSPIANVDLDGLETQYAADGRVVFGPWAKDPVKGGWLYNTPKPSIFNYNEDHSKSNVTKSPASQPRTARQDNLQVSSQVLLAKQRAEKSLEPTSAKAYAEHMQKREHATVGPPDVRQGYTDFEWGMATSPATHWAIGMMLPGYNMTVATAMTYDGVRNGDYLQASLGVVGMAGGGLEYYGRSVASSPRMQLAQLESKTGGHFLSRHGSQTSLSSQYMRAISGLSPDGEVSSSVNSSRFFSDKLQLEAVNQANAQFAATGKSTFTFDMGKLIGEGYLKGGGAGSYRTTTQVQAVYKNGQLNTLYPLIK